MEKIGNRVHAKEIEQLIETLGSTDAGQHTALLHQAKQAIELQQKDLICWEAQSFEVRSHLGQVLNSVFVLMCSNLEEFDWICDMESGTPSEEIIRHLLHLKAFQMGVPVENLDDPTREYVQQERHMEPRRVPINTKHTPEVFQWLSQQADH